MNELDQDVSSPVMPIVSLYPGFSGTSLFTGEGFFDHLNSYDNTYLWVITYSASLRCPLEVPVKRLILELGEFPCKQTQYLGGIHSKLFLQWRGKKLLNAYLGSQNLVRPSNCNLMVKVKRELQKPLVNYFLHHWKG